MTLKIELQPAYVLHTREYRDTSLLVDLLTLDHGIVRAVARGVRVSAGGGNGTRTRRSSRRALLQALQPLLVSMSGRGELLTLTHFEASAAPFILMGDKLFSAMYLHEILCRLMQAQEPHPQIYRLYQASLLQLAHGAAIEPVLRRFEFHLLAELGYAADMQHEAMSGIELNAELQYEFDPLHGFVPASSISAAPASAAVYAGGDILALGQALQQPVDAVFDAVLLQPAKRFMRQALRPHLGNKPLNSRQLFSLPTPRQQ